MSDTSPEAIGSLVSRLTNTECAEPAVGLRLFDLADGLWRIYWIDSTSARLFPPVVGGFEGSEGVFRGQDSPDGQPVLVTFRWDRRDPNRPIWQQAFSVEVATPGKPIGSCTFVGRERSFGIGLFIKRLREGIRRGRIG